MLGKEAQDIWAQTFHSACVRILRAYADRLGYDNNFTIYDTSDSQSVMEAESTRMTISPTSIGE